MNASQLAYAEGELHPRQFWESQSMIAYGRAATLTHYAALPLLLGKVLKPDSLMSLRCCSIMFLLLASTPWSE